MYIGVKCLNHNKNQFFEYINPLGWYTQKPPYWRNTARFISKQFFGYALPKGGRIQ